MKDTKQKTPGDLFVAAVGRGIRRAAKTARKTAKMYGTPIYVIKHGKIVALWP
jgi:hypothetical protein